jgi:predicted DNA-binding transcriptional regulator YafY
MLETSARLLRLLGLLQSRREWPGSELASRFEVTTRTIRADMAKLRSLGYPVEAISGAAGGYRLGSGGLMPPLLLEDDEAVAVAVSLRSAAGRGVIGMEESALRALVKLEQFLPARLRHRVNALQSHIVAAESSKGPGVDPSVLARLAGACRDSEVLWIDYEKHDGTQSSRSVEPYRVVTWGRRWYLVAWDRSRHGWRMFRVDRLRPGAAHGPRFTPRQPPAEDMLAYVRGGIRSATGRFRATVIVQAPAASIAPRLPSDTAIEPIDEQSCRVHAHASSAATLAVYLGMLDADFTTDSAELAGALRRLASRYTAAAAPAA